MGRPAFRKLPKRREPKTTVLHCPACNCLQKCTRVIRKVDSAVYLDYKLDVESWSCNVCGTEP